MSALTIAELTSIQDLGDTIDGTEVTIGQKDGIVFQVPVSMIVTILSEALQPYLLDDINTWATALQQQFDTLPPLIAVKAGINHTHTPAQVGLGSVQNIAPLNMPISNAMQQALDTKLNTADYVVGAEATSVAVNGGAMW